MNTEPVLAHILADIAPILKEVITQTEAHPTPPTLYDLEAQTQGALARIGQALLQRLVAGQGAGVVGPQRTCACGEEQGYQDQRRALTVQTSVGIIQLARRAAYSCPGCAITSYPLDEQLGIGQAGRMSRYLQEQCGWLLALLPTRLAQQTLVRFGWPAVAASQVRK